MAIRWAREAYAYEYKKNIYICNIYNIFYNSYPQPRAEHQTASDASLGVGIVYASVFVPKLLN